LSNYGERTNGFNGYTEVFSGQKGGATIQLSPMESKVLLLLK
jgi:hypothetical protein